jgi:hypothetical protein
MIEYVYEIIILRISTDRLKISFDNAGKEYISMNSPKSENILFRNVRWSLLSLFALFDLPPSLQYRLLHLICSIPDDEPVTGNK